MKIKSKIFPFFFLSAILVCAEEQNALSQEREVGKNFIQSNTAIKQLIKSKKFSEAYAEINNIINARKILGKEKNRINTLSAKANEIQDRAAFYAIEDIYKIVTDLPILTLDEKYSDSKARNTVNELEIKFFAALSIMAEPEISPDANKIMGVNYDEIRQKRMLLVAKILKTFKEIKRDTISNKITRPSRTPIPYEEFEKTNEEISKKEFAYSLNESRKIDSESYLYFLEQSYAWTLLRIYPNNASKIKMAVRDAGYDNKEVNDMLFRALSEYSGTEFLFNKKSNNDTRKNKK